MKIKLSLELNDVATRLDCIINYFEALNYANLEELKSDIEVIKNLLKELKRNVSKQREGCEWNATT